jgi:SAM-dependent methyltransferase
MISGSSLARKHIAMELETLANCPACHSREYHQISSCKYKNNHLLYHYCVNCGWIFMSPRPDGPSLAEYYSQDYFTSATGRGNHNSAIAKQRKFAMHICRTIQSKFYSSAISRRIRILEVGSSYGETLVQLRKSFVGTEIAHASSEVELYAIEPSVVARDIGSNNYTNIRYLGELISCLDSAEYDNYFDLVVLSHVVEHLSNPRASLQRLSECLTRDGLLYIEVPNFYFHPSLEVCHLHCATPRGLMNLTRNSSLQITLLSLNDHRSPIPLYITALAKQNAKSDNQIRKPDLPFLAIKAIRAIGQLSYVGYALLWKMIRKVGRDVFARDVRLPDTFGLL